MQGYAALLRGINVGGKNLIPMVELVACFERLGFEGVRTYIQSGNVLFRSPEHNTAKLTADIESALSKTFGYAVRVVLCSRPQFGRVVEHAPDGFGQDTAHRYYVLFVKKPVRASEVFASIVPREGVDEVAVGDGVVYVASRLDMITKSSLSKIAGTPLYQDVTIRNWNTTKKLYDLLQAME